MASHLTDFQVCCWMRWGFTSSYLVDGRLLDETRGVGRQQAVRGHDVNLVGSSLLQDLCGRNKVPHVVDDVILREDGGALLTTRLSGETTFYLLEVKITERSQCGIQAAVISGCCLNNK